MHLLSCFSILLQVLPLQSNTPRHTLRTSTGRTAARNLPQIWKRMRPIGERRVYRGLFSALKSISRVCGAVSDHGLASLWWQQYYSGRFQQLEHYIHRPFLLLLFNLRTWRDASQPCSYATTWLTARSGMLMNAQKAVKATTWLSWFVNRCRSCEGIYSWYRSRMV